MDCEADNKVICWGYTGLTNAGSLILSGCKAHVTLAAVTPREVETVAVLTDPRVKAALIHICQAKHVMGMNKKKKEREEKRGRGRGRGDVYKVENSYLLKRGALEKKACSS